MEKFHADVVAMDPSPDEVGDQFESIWEELVSNDADVSDECSMTGTACFCWADEVTDGAVLPCWSDDFANGAASLAFKALTSL